MKIQIHDLNKKGKLIKGIIIGILLIITLYFVLAQIGGASMTSSATFSVDAENNKLNYKFNWGETTITLYKQIDKDYYAVFNNIYILPKEKGWKFGANDSSVSGTTNYKYVLNTTNELILLEKEAFDEQENFTYKYPLVYNYHTNPENEWNEFRHIYNFKDICSKENANCEWLWHKNSIEIFFNSDGNIDPEIINVTTCQTLNIENQSYQLNNSLSSTGDCIIVTGYNVSFNLAGYNITGDDYGEDYGIKGSNDYLTIENGSVYDFHTGIYSSNDYITIKNIITNSNNKYGIYLSSNLNNILTDIAANSNTNGIYIKNSSNNFLTNIITDSNNFSGIWLDLSSDNVLVNITTTNNDDYLASSGVRLESSLNNALTNIEADSNYYGVLLWNSNNSIIKDSNISNSITYDVILGSNSTNNIFLNTTYNTDKENVENSELTRKWYYQAYVNDTVGNSESNVNVTAYNVSGDYQFNLTSDSTGYTSITEIIDYVNEGGTRTYYSNYTIYAEQTCYPSFRVYYNVTEQENALNILTLGSSTYQNWDWNFADNCILKDKIYNVENFNITSYGSGSLTLDNVTITSTDFDMNSSESWNTTATASKIIGV